MPRRRLRRGSAFIMAMIALAVLTVVGLSLTMVTQTESTLGETEKVINEQFYAAESGNTAQIATLLATNGLEGINIVVPSLMPEAGAVQPPDGLRRGDLGPGADRHRRDGLHQGERRTAATSSSLSTTT